jgi:poly(hydroxyalkanoate) depolymerase family esterase
MRLRRLVVLALAASAALVSVAPPSSAAALTEVTGFGTNPGNLQMFRYVPDGLPSGRPLVVAIHGCGQSAVSYDNETGWTKWADANGFALVLPQQRTKNNAGRCYNWWLSADSARTGGEAESVAQMVAWMRTTYGSDASRVFVTGLSAGAAMTNVMLATHPDVFAAGAVVAGVPYKCATTAAATGPCNSGTVDRSPAQWGDEVRAAYAWNGAYPRVSVWHGTADVKVSPANLTETMEQWTDANGVDQVADTTDTVLGYPHKVYRDAGGTARVETYSVTGMGHGQPIDPGTGATQCGVAVGYNLDADICGSYWIGTWFGIVA